MTRFLLLLPLVLASMLALPSLARAQDVPAIAAAADLRVALTDIAGAFRHDTGREVRLTFGSSGTFAQQIGQGAPFQLFLSADERYVRQVVAAGRTVDAGVLYGVGRLALVAPKGSPLALDGNLAGLRQALARGQVTHFTIANPAHAPYGERAREALQHARLWQPLQGRLVLGENVSQALQFATAGGAQGGIVSYALVLDPGFAAHGRYVLLPAAWHQPLRQRMVLVKGAGATARAFYGYLQHPAARRVLARYGFVLPGGR